MLTKEYERGVFTGAKHRPTMIVIAVTTRVFPSSGFLGGDFHIKMEGSGMCLGHFSRSTEENAYIQ